MNTELHFNVLVFSCGNRHVWQNPLHEARQFLSKLKTILGNAFIRNLHDFSASLTCSI